MSKNGDQLKLEGIDKVSNGNGNVLLELQLLITRYLIEFNQVTSDDIYRTIGHIPHGVNKNIMGAAFSKHPAIRKSGEYVKSKRPEAHSRMIAIWIRK